MVQPAPHLRIALDVKEEQRKVIVAPSAVHWKVKDGNIKVRDTDGYQECNHALCNTRIRRTEIEV